MRTEPNIQQGTTIVLEEARDLAALSAADVRGIPPAVRAIFVGFPRSFRAIAAETESPPLARWLRRMAKQAACELAIDRPDADLVRSGLLPAAEVHLRVGTAPDTMLLLGGPIARVPKRLPPPLADVLRRVGVVRLQYGAAGGLVAPAAQRRLLDVYAEIANNWGMSEEEAAIPRPPLPRTHWTYFENACGSAMTTNAEGETWHVPMGGGSYVAGPRIEVWLRRFFEPSFVWT